LRQEAKEEQHTKYVEGYNEETILRNIKED
jgi:hypothetical protein